MLTERGFAMPRCGMGAAAALRTASEGLAVPPSAVLPDEDPGLCLLIAEVDAILCDAAATLLRPASPPVAGCALVGPPSVGRDGTVIVQRWSAPAPDVRAVQRSPPRAAFAKNGATTLERGR